MLLAQCEPLNRTRSHIDPLLPCTCEFSIWPLLRPPAEGADTIAWLAADDGRPLASTGAFWHDRRPRPIHRLGSTRRSDTAERREALWA